MLESRFNKVADLKARNFIKKRLQHSCFSVNIAKFLGTTILKSICEWLLLKGLQKYCSQDVLTESCAEKFFK